MNSSLNKNIQIGNDKYNKLNAIDIQISASFALRKETVSLMIS